MKFRTLAVSALTLAMGTTALAQSGPTLKIGDDAPELKDVTWLQGEAISGWKDGEVYVLDFWATWCGPCIRAMPHVQELHEEYADKGVHFIGVSIWPRDGQTPTGDWIDERKDEFTYRFADDNEAGTNANAFMRAAGQNGIPTVMIIDQSGKLAWMGHPMSDMDETLEKIVEGEFDAVTYAKEKQEREERQRKLMEQARPLLQEMERAYHAEEWSKLSAAVDALLRLDEETFSQYALHKYFALIKQGKTAEAQQWGNGMATDLYDDNSGLLNWFAWAIVDPASTLDDDQIDSDLAIKLAKRANELEKGKNPDVLDTLARAYFMDGQYEHAVETVKKAIELEKAEELRAQYEERLQTYQAALESE